MMPSNQDASNILCIETTFTEHRAGDNESKQNE